MMEKISEFTLVNKPDINLREVENQTNQPSPAGIMQIGTGFWASKILLAAVNFQLFTHLARQGSMTGNAIKTLLNFNCLDRHVFDFLDTLTYFGFLKRDGLLETAHYSNGPDTDLFLDRAKPSYIGGLLEMLNDRLYGFWGSLEEALESGKCQNEVKGGGMPFFETIYKDPEKLKGFVNAMTGIQVGNFVALAQSFDFSKYHSFLDIGGSAGILSIMIAKHQPHMNCTTFDLPPIKPVAEETIQKFGLTGRVVAAAGDFFSESFPKADVIAMGNILHDWNEDVKLMLMRKAYEALPHGGAFIAVEGVIDNERRQNVFGMMMSLNMLIENTDGFDYSFADFDGWARQVGFKTTSAIALTGPTSAVIAYK